MVTNMDFSTKANHGSLNWFQSSAACYTMNFYTKLAILISVSADEPSADCDYIEIGLQCQSDCEYNAIECYKSCDIDGFIDTDCARSCLVDLANCEYQCPCFAECPNGCPCGNIEVDQKYC